MMSKVRVAPAGTPVTPETVKTLQRFATTEVGVCALEAERIARLAGAATDARGLALRRSADPLQDDIIRRVEREIRHLGKRLQRLSVELSTAQAAEKADPANVVNLTDALQRMVDKRRRQRDRGRPRSA